MLDGVLIITFIKKINKMATNRIRKSTTRIQVVNSAPAKIKGDRYLSPKGKRLLDNKEINRKEVWAKYGKIKYHVNPNSKPTNKQIKHAT